MAGSWTVDRFPQFEAAIRRLTEQHRELEHEPLHLAVSYLPARRDPQHIYLSEMIGSAEERVRPEHDLFEVTFEAMPCFPMGPGEQLHLILTNRRELDIALREGWTLAREVVEALHAGDSQVLFQEEIGREVLDRLREEARCPEAVRG